MSEPTTNPAECWEIREPGGVLQGYAILMAGVWDGWLYVPDSPGRRLVIVSMGRSRSETIAAIAAHAAGMSG